MAYQLLNPRKLTTSSRKMQQHWEKCTNIYAEINDTRCLIILLEVIRIILITTWILLVTSVMKLLIESKISNQILANRDISMDRTSIIPWNRVKVEKLRSSWTLLTVNMEQLQQIVLLVRSLEKLFMREKVAWLLIQYKKYRVNSNSGIIKWYSKVHLILISKVELVTSMYLV